MLPRLTRDVSRLLPRARRLEVLRTSLLHIRGLQRNDYALTAHRYLLESATRDIERVARLWPRRGTAQSETLRLALINGTAAWSWLVGGSARPTAGCFGFSFAEACQVAELDGDALRARLLSRLPQELVDIFGSGNLPGRSLTAFPAGKPVAHVDE